MSEICKGVARVGDLVKGKCECCGREGIVGYISTGSDTVITNFKKLLDVVIWSWDIVDIKDI